MGFFSNILEKLGMKEAAAAPVITPPPAAAAAAPAPAPVAAAPAAPVVNSISMVDVVALLTEKAANHPEKLNWKTSIVDLLKLLGLDSSLAARKELAKELYCPDELMGNATLPPAAGTRASHASSEGPAFRYTSVPLAEG